MTHRLSREVTDDELFAGMLVARVDWLAVCRWCLGVIYREPGTDWAHLDRGFRHCSRPVVGTPAGVEATPMPFGQSIEQHLRERSFAVLVGTTRPCHPSHAQPASDGR